jgi:hypothetical protein
LTKCKDFILTLQFLVVRLIENLTNLQYNQLDKAVDLAYRSQPFTSEAKRMEFLFELYEKYTADLFTKEKTKKKR